MDKQTFIDYIRSFKFRELFNELGWNNISISPIPVKIDQEIFTLTAVAEKRGFIIFQCSYNSQGKIPTKDIRKKIDTKISKLYFEHLIIYSDKNNTQQIWQLVIREQDKPLIVRETDYFSTQHPELLFQKLRGLFISIDQEDNITLADVRAAVREQFNTNAERVTRKFYDEFKKHHNTFKNFISGIENIVDKEWYTSLILNRLMFIYFIQKKGFLDNNPNYLRDKLRETQLKKGKNKFYSFYRNFLLVLFHKGLGSPERNDELIKEIGKVPYFNGGLFDIHQIEKDYKNINIDDKAFEKIFDFFDQYNWHLDTRVTASGKDINPDVIGYIFEKYINDRAALGAYYTKEDITEYIAKNTIIPFLFDQVKKDCANAFKDDSYLWKMLRENPDNYIYDAVKHGVNLTKKEFNSTIDLDDPNHPLWKNFPDEIKQGFRPDLKDKIVVADERPHLWEIRKEWNKPAPSDVALPTEIWREVIERHKRYFEIRRKITNGEIKEINDFITYNLNIRQFAQDAVEQYEGSDFINAFYKAITKITVLDPTCGSGAFLFAALNILEPLYYACIERMKGFIELDDLQGGKKFPQFRKVIEDIKQHPSQQYYIYKSIILNNLYGVDIMKEAVEIAKLRLFLKLVAEVDEFDHLEPLPDIDFNIRSGNTLIGYANKKEIEELGGLFITDEMKKKIFDECDLVAKAFTRFKEIQLDPNSNKTDFSKAKEELNERLNTLKKELDKILHKQQYEGMNFNKWLETHKPFHWFAEFYEIMENGGFDVIIGNPPYVEYKTVDYSLSGYNSLSSGNLYAFSIERSNHLLADKGRFGMIVPSSATSTDGYIPIQKILLKKGYVYVSSYSDQRGKLFDIPHPRLSIIIYDHNIDNRVYTSNYIKLGKGIYREYLFQRISYFNSSSLIQLGRFPRIIFRCESYIFNKIFSNKSINYLIRNKSIYKIFYTRKISWFLQVLLFIPRIISSNGSLRKPSELKEISFDNESYSMKYFCTLNSTLFYWFVTVGSDCRNLNSRETNNFPINIYSDKLNKLINLSNLLSEDLKNNSEEKTMNFVHDTLTIQCIYPQKSKPIIDEIDTVLAEHYGFTEEELDFIINYDIKYRMGKQNEEDE